MEIRSRGRVIRPRWGRLAIVAGLALSALTGSAFCLGQQSQEQWLTEAYDKESADAEYWVMEYRKAQRAKQRLKNQLEAKKQRIAELEAQMVKAHENKGIPGEQYMSLGPPADVGRDGIRNEQNWVPWVQIPYFRVKSVKIVVDDLEYLTGLLEKDPMNLDLRNQIELLKKTSEKNNVDCK